MLYQLLYPLKDYFFAFNVFRYITFRSAYATVTALLIAFIFGPKMIRWAKNLQIGQRVRKDGPSGHAGKEGTPTMGGVLIIAAIVIPTIFWADLRNPYIQLVLAVTIGMGLIGFLDDYLLVVKKRDKGLVGRYKLLGQLGFGAVLGAILYFNPAFNGEVARTAVPFFKDLYIDWGILYIPLVMLVVTGTSNAVNLTDGLDGLATGVSAFCFFAFASLASVGSQGVCQLPQYTLSRGEWRDRHLLHVGSGRRSRISLVQRPPGRDLHGRHRFPRSRRGPRYRCGVAQEGITASHNWRDIRGGGPFGDNSGALLPL